MDDLFVYDGILSENTDAYLLLAIKEDEVNIQRILYKSIVEPYHNSKEQLGLNIILSKNIDRIHKITFPSLVSDISLFSYISNRIEPRQNILDVEGVNIKSITFNPPISSRVLGHIQMRISYKIYGLWKNVEKLTYPIITAELWKNDFRDQHLDFPVATRVLVTYTDGYLSEHEVDFN